MSSDQDITRLQESEETLRRYRTLLATSSRLGRICYWSIDYADEHYETSDNAPELLGWPKGITRIRESDFSARIHPDDLLQIVAQRRAAFRDDQPTEIDYRFWHAIDKRWIFLRSLLFFVRNPNG
jgi:PAS domain-containing protein